MTALSININKVATIRNARGGNIPNVIQFAKDCQMWGADGITVHPRPDERHITKKDVFELKKIITTEFNIEGNPTPDFVKMICEIKPDQVTLVPDNKTQLTSDHGWDTEKNFVFLKKTISIFKSFGIRTSIFLDPEKRLVKYAKEAGADRIELYTEKYAKLFSTNKLKAIELYSETAIEAEKYKLGVNAGHDLNLENLTFFHNTIPNLLEVSIGHAFISDCLYYGLQNTISLYKNKLRIY